MRSVRERASQTPAGPVRAAQYVRMSTEHQQYSTENQMDAIGRYAEARKMQVVRTYSDGARSGLNIEGRNALRDLIRDVIVGDKRQHEAVEAGRTYQQLQEAGMQTARLDEIVRQKDPALKEVVEQLARGNVWGAVSNLENQGRVHEIVSREERLTEIATAGHLGTCKRRATYHRGVLLIRPDPVESGRRD